MCAYGSGVILNGLNNNIMGAVGQQSTLACDCLWFLESQQSLLWAPLGREREIAIIIINVYMCMYVCMYMYGSNG